MRYVFFAIFLLLPVVVAAFPPPGEFEFEARQGSIFCLGCHDAVLARHMKTDHPIDVDYSLARVKRNSALKYISPWDPVIKLENGRVGCTSCHNRNSRLPARLAVSNAGSQLCLACHNL